MTGYRGGSTIGRYSSRCPAGRCAAEAEPGTSKLQHDLFTLLRVPFRGGDPDYRVGKYSTDMAFRLTPSGLSAPDGSLMLVVEYDGAYWHAGREASDLRKTEWITAYGGPEHHEVVRLREEPLKKVGRYDIEVPKRSDPLLCARLLAMHVLHEFLEWSAMDAIRSRVEHFLIAADSPLDHDQVRCSMCWKVALMVNDLAEQSFPPLGWTPSGRRI